MEFRELATFIKAAELQSFSKAAQQLGYSQSAVTVQIKSLEKELGIDLFERIGKRVRLTGAGMKFWESTTKIMNELEYAKNSLGKVDQLKGSLRIAAAESLLISVLPHVIEQIKKQGPDVRVSVKTGVIAELFEMIRQNDVDLLYFLDKRIHFPEWVKVFEREVPIVFVASVKNPIAQEKHISIERLLKEPFLLTEKGISYQFDLEQLLAERDLEIVPFLETGNTDVIAQLLLENVGVSFLPEYVVHPYVVNGELKVLDVDFPATTMWSQLVYHKNKRVTPQMQLCIDLLLAAPDALPFPH